MEEKKHVCKHCNKRFTCGKSLGGHIRIHMMTEHYSVNSNNEEKNNATMLKRKRDLGSCGVGDDGNFIYGLRENPKRTMRFVHSSSNVNNNNSQMENFCKECGKGFTSLKALCGHMACHSEKDKGRFENNSDSVITEKQKLVDDDSNSSSSQSDAEISLPMKSTRSKRIKFKSLSNNSYKSLTLLNGSCSSSVSEIDNEKEEGAKCLILLSNDKRPFTLVIDSSDNNSVVLEEKSPSPKKKLKHNEVKYYDSDDYDSDNSDSGYFLYGPKKLDSADEVKSSKGYFEYLDNDSRKRLRPNNDSVAQNLVGASTKRAKNGENNEHDDSAAYESDENSTDSDSYPAAKTQNNNNNNNNSCKNLNGKVNKCKKGKKKLKSKKSKEHECPICNKIFKSGQALGGHKRSHFIGGYEENNTFVIRPNPPPPAPPAAPAAPAPAAPAPTCLIDLNLPAPDDE